MVIEDDIFVLRSSEIVAESARRLESIVNDDRETRLVTPTLERVSSGAVGVIVELLVDVEELLGEVRRWLVENGNGGDDAVVLRVRVLFAQLLDDILRPLHVLRVSVPKRKVN